VTPLADARGVLYAAPDGRLEPGGARFWSATDACCNFVGAPDDDSAYLRGLIDQIDAHPDIAVDRDRIFFAGLSNGGFMSHRMACDHADLVAAIASQAGAAFNDPARCLPASPVHDFLFIGGPGPAAPHPECGTGVPADAELGCAAASAGCR
jgi:polyhydroxybutyrate depolymerase